MDTEMDTYPLIADCMIETQGEVKTISKVCVRGSSEESSTESKVNVHIASERLKMEYQRPKDANIEFDGEFFQDWSRLTCGLQRWVCALHWSHSPGAQMEVEQ
jgi:hypothetical protein